LPSVRVPASQRAADEVEVIAGEVTNRRNNGGSSCLATIRDSVYRLSLQRVVNVVLSLIVRLRWNVIPVNRSPKLPAKATDPESQREFGVVEVIVELD
jgi:hypothetical protein